MAKRRFQIVIFLLCLCLMATTAHAVSTTDALTPISTQRDCSLTVSYRYDGTPFAGQQVNLYQVASVSANCQYSLTTPFAASELILNGISSNSEWDVIRTTLDAYIFANDIAPLTTLTTDDTGSVCFASLEPGLYLTSTVYIEQEDQTCIFDPALVALPGLDTAGNWQYDVAVSAKPEILPPITPDEKMELSVLKLWKSDDGKPTRPQSIEVEIFRDGVSYETVILSEENLWSYTWSVEDDGATWKVVERKVPAGYTMTVTQRETTFVITNTYRDPSDPKPPKTGDSANVLLYTVLMFASGSMLIILGITGKRKDHEETT